MVVTRVKCDPLNAIDAAYRLLDIQQTCFFKHITVMIFHESMSVIP